MLEREQKVFMPIVGADEKNIPLPESIYSKTESAIEVIQKGKNIFYSRRRNKKLFATEVKIDV